MAQIINDKDLIKVDWKKNMYAYFSSFVHRNILIPFGINSPVPMNMSWYVFFLYICSDYLWGSSGSFLSWIKEKESERWRLMLIIQGRGNKGKFILKSNKQGQVYT